jgi:mRNA-degrading endonuclease RelE of RelBE toxin-antitoxin system
MKIDYHRDFTKDYKKIDFKIRDKFKEKLRLFMNNPFLKELNNHSLN